MLSRPYKEDEQADIVKLRVVTLRVSYTDELLNKLDTALHFVIRKMGFATLPPLSYSVLSGNELIQHDPDGNKLTLIFQKLENSAGINTIIFHTDDCLRDYHRYILLGVEFTSRPQYHAAGLQVNFIDDYGNCYTLLEERIYTES
jgi:hypothetical protein